MIIAFATEKDITLSTEDVVSQFNTFDNDKIDVEMTPGMLPVVAGGESRCT
jgi:hypothetical protein